MIYQDNECLYFGYVSWLEVWFVKYVLSPFPMLQARKSNAEFQKPKKIIAQKIDR